jgi:hypothetical protein
MRLKRLLLAPIFLGACALIGWPREALAWGDEGHAIVALIADHYLAPQARDQVRALLDGDRSGLVTDTSIASESVWADRYRDSDRDATRVRYDATRQWHYIDLEIDSPDVSSACFGHPSIAAGVPASAGPAQDCVTDKIDQFESELKDPHTPIDERRLALQFLLHFVGDLHQPLHAGDERDQGGNLEQVQAPGLPPANLHRYWDVEFVEALGRDPGRVAGELIDRIGAADVRDWNKGTTSDWALESYAVAKAVAYGRLPAPITKHHYALPPDYVQSARGAVDLQLRRAGVRLAWVLNRSLS